MADSNFVPQQSKNLMVATLLDVNKLIDNMQAKSTGYTGPTYANLAEEWRKMQFSNIFCRSNADEVVEYTPVTFLAAKINMIPPTEMDRRVYALLVLYGLFTKQPCDKICKIRINHKEWTHLLELFQYCATNDYKQQCFIIEKLWSTNAFDFVYSPVDMSYILSGGNNFQDLGVIAMEAIEPRKKPTLPQTDPNLLVAKVRLSQIKEKEAAYNSLAEDLHDFKACTLSEKLENILKKVPQQKPRYSAFVNSTRRMGRIPEVDSSAKGIGQRRRDLINRPVSKTHDQNLVPVPKTKSKPNRTAVDPSFAFIHTSGSRCLSDHYKRMAKMFEQEESAGVSTSEHQLHLTEEEQQTFDDHQEKELTKTVSEVNNPREPKTAEVLLKEALSMPVVEWHDNE